jgi:methionyl-tRNA formyltransferase
MRIAFIGHNEFGKATLEAFIARGDTIAGVFCAPEKPGEKPDPVPAGCRCSSSRACATRPPCRPCASSTPTWA